MIFLVLVILPSIRNHPDKVKLLHQAGLKFRSAGWVALILILITGLFQLHVRGSDFSLSWFSGSDFGKLAFWKLVVFSVITVASLFHDFYFGIRATEKWMKDENSREAMKFRMVSRWIGRLNLVLGLVALFLGIALVRGI